jgi:hypothetical protein
VDFAVSEVLVALKEPFPNSGHKRGRVIIKVDWIEFHGKSASRRWAVEQQEVVPSRDSCLDAAKLAARCLHNLFQLGYKSLAHFCSFPIVHPYWSKVKSFSKL